MSEEISALRKKLLLSDNPFDKKTLESFIRDFVPREERHYCAYLFSWLLASPQNLKHYVNAQNGTSDILKNISDEDYSCCRIYYEFTGLRELIHFVSKKASLKKYETDLIRTVGKGVFGNGGKGDAQKKKPDLAFYFPLSKLLIVVEAKFESGFDEPQFMESKRYGEVLQEFFPDDIHKVELTLLGLDYYLKPYINNYASISWEMLTKIIDNSRFKDEIIRGLDYQKHFHPKAMEHWTNPKQIKNKLFQ